MKVILRETPYEVSKSHPVKLLPEKILNGKSLVRNTEIYDAFIDAKNSLADQLLFSEANKLFANANSEREKTLLGVSSYSTDSSRNPVILRKSLLEINTETEHSQLINLVSDVVSRPLVTDNSDDEKNIIRGLDAVYAFRRTQPFFYAKKNEMIGKYQSLFDEEFSTYNIRSMGSIAVETNSTANGTYKFYQFNVDSPFYTVITDDAVNAPTMEIMCRSFILPMERFKQSDNVYIFKYPEWLIGDKKRNTLSNR